MTSALLNWTRESDARIKGSRPLDEWKVQAPCAVRLPEGGYRLFYTGVGREKPYANCQGYILSATSSDGLDFEVEEGTRVTPRPELQHMSLRILAPTIVATEDGRWRMYFESRGTADRPTVICSAISGDLLDWRHEEGIRFEAFDGVGGPRYVKMPNGGGRLYCFSKGQRQGVISATTSDGLSFTLDDGIRLLSGQTEYDSAGISAAEVLPPSSSDGLWTMVYSAWQDVPPGTEVPLHPSQDPDAAINGNSADFAAASIASDLAGYRSRIFVAHSEDGLEWQPGRLVLQGAGYDSDELDGVHAEDMSLIEIDDGRYRMYYAACDRHGSWCVASAVSE